MSRWDKSVYQTNDVLQLDWQHTAPADYESLEMFITPEVSFLFKEIKAGKEKFVIGAQIARAEKKRQKFLQEVIPQRSDERIRRSFTEEGMSAFFTKQEAEAFQAVFDQFEFSCQHVEILHLGRAKSLSELPSDIFEIVSKEFVRLKLFGRMEYDESAVNVLQNMHDDIHRTLRAENAKRSGGQPKTAAKHGAIAGTLVSVSMALAWASKTLWTRGGLWGLLAAGACKLLSLASGVLAHGYLEDALKFVREGWVMKYV